MSIEEEKAGKLPENPGEDGENEEEREEEREKEKTPKNPWEALKELTSGKLELMQPFRAHGQDVTEVAFDFCGLTNEEMLDALDSAPVNNILTISNKQAMALFAATAAKCSPRAEGERFRIYDATDIRKKLGPADAVKAIQIAKVFYNASSRAGGRNISK